jgi:hypothetical protein
MALKSLMQKSCARTPIVCPSPSPSRLLHVVTFIYVLAGVLDYICIDTDIYDRMLIIDESLEVQTSCWLCSLLESFCRSDASSHLGRPSGHYPVE